MTAILARIAVLLAVLLMPVGMTGANAAPAGHSTMSMPTMAMGHCPDTGDHRQGQDMPADCTTACASVLPSVPVRFGDVRSPLPANFGMPGRARALTGTLLETATPPPRIA